LLQPQLVGISVSTLLHCIQTHTETETERTWEHENISWDFSSWISLEICRADLLQLMTVESGQRVQISCVWKNFWIGFRQSSFAVTVLVEELENMLCTCILCS
jgi:hypothetical protein